MAGGPQPAGDTQDAAATRDPLAQSRSRARGRSEEAIDETVEFDSDGEGGDTSPVAAANRASTPRPTSAEHRSPSMRCPAPVPLAAMISSDEEEDDPDDGRLPIAAPRAKVGAHAEAAITAGGDRSPPLLQDPPRDPPREDDEPMPLQPTGADRRELPASAGGWDSEEDSSSPPLPHMERNARAPVYGEMCGEDDAGPPPAPEPPCIMAAPGIAADDNFAEDDWDDDEA